MSFLHHILPLGVSAHHFAEFNKLLARVVERKIPLSEGLTMVTQGLRSWRLKSAMEEVRNGVLEGKSLDAAMEVNPHLFPGTYRAIVRAGLASGNLSRALNFAGTWYEAKAKTLRAAVSTLLYTYSILIVVCIVHLILSDVGASFENMFQELGIDISTMTRVTLAILKRADIAVLLILLIPVCLCLGWRLLFLTPRMGQAVYNTPIIGKIAKILGIARFCSLSGALFTAHEPIPKSLVLCSQAENNWYFKSVLKRVGEAFADGKGFAEAMASENHFPWFLRWMTAVGEKRGDLPQALTCAAKFYTKEAERLTASVATFIEPLLIVGVGAWVGFIVISIYSPLISLMRSM